MGRTNLLESAFSESTLNISKRILYAFSAVSAFYWIGAASGADMPVKAPMVAPVVAYNWSGFYIGGNVGGGWGNDRSVVLNPQNIASGHLLLIAGLGTGPIGSVTPLPVGIGHSSGFIGGGQIGYNFQFSPKWVIGIEADLDGADVRGSATIPQIGGDPLNHTNLVASRRLDWFGTVRGRLGITPFDRLLIYGTGGLAFGEEKGTASLNNLDAFTFATGFHRADGSSIDCFAASPCAAGSGSRTSAGWAVGAGFEYAFWNNLSIKAEYLHLELGGLTAQMGPVIIPTFVNNPAFQANFGIGRYDIFRVGMNYRFNSAVVAKY
jgi:outer membrane immunogenic protein